uniref:Ubiquitin conjugating enzyme E2 E2 n=1 Tax=Ornithorhynchus anatinus TaxID=9258 RepID=A0A6I8PGW6_ORNAN
MRVPAAPGCLGRAVCAWGSATAPPADPPSPRQPEPSSLPAGFSSPPFQHKTATCGDPSAAAAAKQSAFKMSTEGQRVDDSPSTSGGSSDGDQRDGVQQEQEREQVQPKKKEGKISSKTAAKLSTSAKRIQKELAEITLDPPPNCRFGRLGSLSTIGS